MVDIYLQLSISSARNKTVNVKINPNNYLALECHVVKLLLGDFLRSILITLMDNMSTYFKTV